MRPVGKIVVIAAVARNGVIGADNRLLWRLKSDMRHFRALTMGKPVVMGRKTFDSIGKPLPGRHIVVVTRDKTWRGEGVEASHSVEAALRRGREIAAGHAPAEIMIAGGGEIYAATLPVADRLEITEVDLEPEGDVRFPAIDRAIWRETKRESHPKGVDDEAAFAFVTYCRD